MQLNLCRSVAVVSELLYRGVVFKAEITNRPGSASVTRRVISLVFTSGIPRYEVGQQLDFIF